MNRPDWINRPCKSAFALALFAFALLAIVMVAPLSAATLCVSHTPKAGCKTTITAALALAAPGDTINVAQGTYTEQVTITQSISIIGDPFNAPEINAAGKSNGFFINGTATAPAPGVANVTISGFKVQNANFEGVLVANASNVTLLANHVFDNNKALVHSTPSSCPGIPAFETNEQSDCGEGIHLMAADHALVSRNLIDFNSGGILITDETGVSYSNVIQGNIVHDNGYACGITMAGHPPATSLIPSAQLPFGIMHNLITGNQSYHNGLLLPGAGAGVGIFAPFPGTVNTANVVNGNYLYDNGLPGVTMHNHASAPAPAPRINLNDNVIIGNHIYGNAADTEDAATSGTTGINIYSTGPITGLVVAQNFFSDETIDVAFKAPGGSLDAHFNDFSQGSIGIDNLGSAVISATENWWHCTTGPSTNCSTVGGTGVTVAPWMQVPFSLDLQ